jgi:hypothetical protein
MSDEGVHPGSWVGDSVEEFKKLPTWGKALAVGTLVLVAYLGYKAYSSNKSGPALSQQGNLPPTNNPQGSSSPFPQVSSGDTSVPLLPSDVNPIFNGAGSLVGYQSTPTQNTATPPTQVGATPNQPNPITSFFVRDQMGSVQNKGVPIRATPGGSITGYAGYGSSLSLSGDAVSGPSNNPQTPGVQNSTNWYKTSTGGYVSSADVVSKGSGGMSWQSRVYRLTHYTPQTGDNMNEIARKLGYSGWQDLGNEFRHGERIKLP